MKIEGKEPEEGAECEKSQKELDEKIKKKKERQVDQSLLFKDSILFSRYFFMTWSGCLHGGDQPGGGGGGHCQGRSIPAISKTAQNIIGGKFLIFCV